VFHVTLLSPYHQMTAHGYTPPPPVPDIIDGHDEFEVEAILGHRTHRRQIQFYIKWKGYARSDSTWEPSRNLTNCTGLLKTIALDTTFLCLTVIRRPP